MTKKKIIIKAMGKQITIDNPTDIEIRLKDEGRKAFKFNMQINTWGTRKLARAYKKLGRGRK